jgi:hypothetical protein
MPAWGRQSRSGAAEGNRNIKSIIAYTIDGTHRVPTAQASLNSEAECAGASLALSAIDSGSRSASVGTIASDGTKIGDSARRSLVEKTPI